MSEIDKSLWSSVDERLAGYRRMREAVRGLPSPSAQSVSPNYRKADTLCGGANIGGKLWAQTQEMMRHIYAKTDEALLQLLGSGVAVERITRFTQAGTGHTGLAVDDEPVWWSRVEHKDHTIQVRFEWETTQPSPASPEYPAD
jgi:hypothetical protein